MKTTQQIIQHTYDTNPNLKEQLDLYGLTLKDVGITYWNKNHTKVFKKGEIPDVRIEAQHNAEAPIVLGYSMEDKKVMSHLVSFTHPKIEESMRVRRLGKIGRD